MAIQLPRRFTQAWIERTLPTVGPDDVERVMAAMREKGWTESDLAERVFPHLPATGTAAQSCSVSPDQADTKVDLPCPRGHRNSYDREPGYRTLACPTCQEKTRDSRFVAAVDLVCKAVEQAAITRRPRLESSNRRIRVGADYQVAYLNPEPPPPQRLLRFRTGQFTGALHLKSGHRFSVVFKARKRPLKGAQACFLVNHEVGETWRL